jgi:ADP-ribosylarginine hydrolase
MSDKFNNFFASIYLAMVGDKIGFGNGERERNYKTEPIMVENNNNYISFVEGMSSFMVFRFISEGGVSGLNLNTLSVSDDTEMHVATINGLTSDFKGRDALYNNIVDLYLDTFKDLNHARDKLLAGVQTINAIKNISSGVNWKNFAYSKSAGGSGGPMRTMCLGLAFYRTTDLLKLIESSIMICSITHPNCIAFIGSIASALFTSYAIRGLNIETWIFELIQLLESNVIDDLIEKLKPSYIEYFKEDKKEFLHKLLTYVETSFSEYNYIINTNSIRSIYPAKRMTYYFDNFSANKKVFNPGSGADDVIIIAYDCLLMSKSNFEKLIYLSMINIADSDTIGSIASAWYGALYGFDNVPNNLNLNLELHYEEMKKLSEDLYNKYYEKSVDFF